MAEGRRRQAGELAAWHAAFVVAHLPLTGASHDPAEINPYRERRPRSEALRKLEEWQARRAWRGMFGAGKKKDPAHAGRQGG